jgi:hypothetical protein
MDRLTLATLLDEPVDRPCQADFDLADSFLRRWGGLKNNFNVASQH